MSYDDRFAGLARLYGPDAVNTFKQAKVVIVGIGGVGSWIAEALARTGFNHLYLIDMDDICITNTNRQVHTSSSTIGHLKVEAMADRLRAINPEIQVEAVMDFLTKDNITQYLSGMDFVIDAIDSVKVKAAMMAWCKSNKVPVVMTGGAGGQVDPTKITVGDLNKTYNDPLAKKVRSILRREYNFSRNEKRNYGILCVYSIEQLRYPKADGSVCLQKNFKDNDRSVNLDCSGGLGAATMVTATFGFIAAAKVVEKLAEKGLSKKNTEAKP